MSINWRKPLIFFLLQASGSRVVKNLSYIHKFNSLPADEQKRIQQKKLIELLNFTAENVPYYKTLFKKHKLIEGGKVNLDNFKKLPFLDKGIIRKEGKNLYSKDWQARKTYENTSGGSTGEPVKFLQDKEYSDWNIANKIYYAQRVGKDVGEKEIKLWGSERDILEGSIGWKDKCINWLYNRKLLNSFMMSDEDMKEYIAIINQFQPKHIWSYVDSIFYLARFAKANKLQIHKPSSIIVTAGVLDEKVRKFVEGVFKTPVYNQYGSREVGDMAAENQIDNGLRLFLWSHFVEIINEEIVVTCFTNYAMPLIRYKIGDTGKFSSDKLALTNITGRTTNHFKKKDGTVVHGEYFTHLFYFKPWVKQFKVVQVGLQKITCYVENATNPHKQDLIEIERQIKVVMGQDCFVKFVFVSTIKPSKSGKHIYTESRI